MKDPYLDALVEEQNRIARESLTRPGSGHPAYEYGYRIGLYAGMERAIQRLLALYRDEKEDKFE